MAVRPETAVLVRPVQAEPSLRADLAAKPRHLTVGELEVVLGESRLVTLR